MTQVSRCSLSLPLSVSLSLYFVPGLSPLFSGFDEILLRQKMTALKCHWLIMFLKQGRRARWTSLALCSHSRLLSETQSLSKTTCGSAVLFFSPLSDVLQRKWSQGLRRKKLQYSGTRSTVTSVVSGSDWLRICPKLHLDEIQKRGPESGPFGKMEI